MVKKAETIVKDGTKRRHEPANSTFTVGDSRLPRENVELRKRKYIFSCDNCALRKMQSTAKAMSGRCLHFMGLLPKIRMSRHPKSASNTTNHPSKPLRLMYGWLFLGRLRPERSTSNKMVSQ